MRIILVSDSHGNKYGLEKLMENESFDYLFFLGDGLSDLGLYDNLENVIAVSGNCDFFSAIPNERVVKVGSNLVLATHGNKYGVKLGMNKIRKRAEEEGVDFVFFGHTNKPCVEFVNGIYYVNPGTFHKNFSGDSYFMEVVIDGEDVKFNQLRI
jgi:putative phosphoesterase